MEEELIPVTLWLAGRGYRIRIKKQDEAAIRMAAKIADQRVNELRNTFAGKDDQDFIAMCLLMYATDMITDPSQLNVQQRDWIEQIITKIDQKLNAE